MSIQSMVNNFLSGEPHWRDILEQANIIAHGLRTRPEGAWQGIVNVVATIQDSDVYRRMISHPDYLDILDFDKMSKQDAATNEQALQKFFAPGAVGGVGARFASKVVYCLSEVHNVLRSEYGSACNIQEEFNGLNGIEAKLQALTRFNGIGDDAALRFWLDRLDEDFKDNVADNIATIGYAERFFDKVTQQNVHGIYVSLQQKLHTAGHSLSLLEIDRVAANKQHGVLPVIDGKELLRQILIKLSGNMQAPINMPPTRLVTEMSSRVQIAAARDPYEAHKAAWVEARAWANMCKSTA